jgi:predicted Zn-dependent protease
VSTDPVVAEYVNRLGQNLVRNSEQTEFAVEGSHARPDH